MKDIVIVAQNGDKEAKGLLIKRLEPLIYKMMLRVPKQYRDVDDLYQQSALIILNLLNSYDESKNITFPAYVKINLTYYYLDRTKLKRVYISLDDNKEDSVPLLEKIQDLTINNQQSNYIERKENINNINNALKALTNKQKVAVVSFYIQNKSITEIANLLDCSYSTAVKHKTKGMEKIRKYFNNNT